MQPTKRKGTPFYEDRTAMFVAPILGALAVGWGIYTSSTAGNRADEAEAQVQTLSVQVRDAQNETHTATDRSTDLSAQLAALRKSHTKELTAQRTRLQKGFDERMSRERASWERQLAEARAAAVPDLPATLPISDSLAADDAPPTESISDQVDAARAFEQRCLDAIAADMGVESVRKTWGGMLSARPWGPPEADLWFWKPMVRVVATGHKEQYTCRTSNDVGFEVFPGL